MTDQPTLDWKVGFESLVEAIEESDKGGEVLAAITVTGMRQQRINSMIVGALTQIASGEKFDPSRLSEIVEELSLMNETFTRAILLYAERKSS